MLDFSAAGVLYGDRQVPPAVVPGVARARTSDRRADDEKAQQQAIVFLGITYYSVSTGVLSGGRSMKNCAFSFLLQRLDRDERAGLLGEIE